MSPLRVGVLASHDGTTAQAVIDACASGELDAQVVLVISNNRDAGVISRARDAGIAWQHLSGKTHPDQSALDAAIRAALEDAGVSVVLLAGYMKRLGPETLTAFEGRMLNTHPALLPKYGGQGMYGDKVHRAVLTAGDTETGASVHLVTREYDEGPVLRQVAVPIVAGDDACSLGERVRRAERQLVVSVLRGWLGRDIESQ